MKILGIDTATNVCGVAFTEDERLVTEIRSNFKRAHAEKLIGAINTVLTEADIALNNLDAIAVSIGPGSFTGLRIGLSTAKGLAFANQLPVVAVNTLDALASQAILWQGQVCALIRAQADEAYAAFYRSIGFRQQRVSEYQLIDLNQIEQFIKEQTLMLHVGIRDFNRYLLNTDTNLINVAPEHACLLSGGTIARLGYEKIRSRETEEIDSLEPYYLKEFKVKLKGGRSA